MTTITQSLLDHLGSRNPMLDVSRCRPGRNTTSRRTPWTNPGLIEEWNDFECDALNKIYGGVLRETLDHQLATERVTVPHLPFCEIHDEKSFESIVVLWNQTVVSKALEATYDRLKDRLPLDKVYMCLGGQAQLPCTGRRPDWAGVKRSTVSTDVPEAKSRNILPGDTKVSSKWSSTDIEHGVVEEAKKKLDWIQPLGQVYTYCVRANARYGYVITAEELVVFRIRPSLECSTDSPSCADLGSLKAMDPKINIEKLKALNLTNGTPAERAEANGTLEFKAIPWAHHFQNPHGDCRVMTVNLALWWLHMMAAENSFIEERYPPLKDAVWSPRPQSQSASVTSSDRLRPALAKKTNNRRAGAPSLGPKRRDRKRPREMIGDTAFTGQHASPQKRRTRRHV
jgi:hypothetical protein